MVPPGLKVDKVGMDVTKVLDILTWVEGKALEADITLVISSRDWIYKSIMVMG